jgi:chromate reductase, NAD(P)H dehydrogenase (quinone)
MTRIAVLVGSLRNESINMRYAQELEKLAPKGVEFVFANLNLPLFNQDLEADFPAEARAVKDVLAEADGVLIVTPEYNRSFPGVLKNAIDWASRPWGSNSFDAKPVALVGVSGALGTTQAQQQLRNVMLHLNTHLMGQPEMYINGSMLYGEDGSLNDDARSFAEKFLNTFLEHIKRFQP